MLTDFFDTMGTATAISEQAGIADEEGQPPQVGRVLLVDSLAAVAGGAAGISSNTSYIESAAGVAEGGRTGFTSVVTGVLFLLAILLTPLATLVPFVATAPVLVVVGFLMVSLIKDIDFSDIEEGMPALLGLILMPLTFSITVGIGAAFVAHVVIKVVRGKITEIHPLLWAVAIAFVIYFGQSWITSDPSGSRRPAAASTEPRRPGPRPGRRSQFLYHRPDVRTDRAASRTPGDQRPAPGGALGLRGGLRPGRFPPRGPRADRRGAFHGAPDLQGHRGLPHDAHDQRGDRGRRRLVQRRHGS